MVERFHEDLKAFILCKPGIIWLHALNLVLLGLCGVVEGNLNAFPEELVYAEPLRLLGELLAKPLGPEGLEDAVNLVVHLRLPGPFPASRYVTEQPLVFQHLITCFNSFLRDDTVRRSLYPPYSDPHTVL